MSRRRAAAASFCFSAIGFDQPVQVLYMFCPWDGLMRLPETAFLVGGGARIRQGSQGTESHDPRCCEICSQDVERIETTCLSPQMGVPVSCRLFLLHLFQHGLSVVKAWSAMSHFLCSVQLSTVQGHAASKVGFVLPYQNICLSCLVEACPVLVVVHPRWIHSPPLFVSAMMCQQRGRGEEDRDHCAGGLPPHWFQSQSRMKSRGSW